MNILTFFPALALHGTLLVCGAGAVWLSLRRQSAARVSAGGGLIMAATLLLAAVEIIFAVSRSQNGKVTVPGEAVLPAASLLAPGPVTDALPAPGLYAGGSSPDVLPASVPAAAVETPPPERHWELSRTTASILTIVWLAGAALIIVRWAFAMEGRRRWQRSASPVEDAEWITLLRQIPGGERVQLLLHPGNTVPCAWRGLILLPCDADAWPAEQRRMVLEHECAHLRRRDPLWLAVAQWFLALQWFNPMAWCVVRRCRLAAERAVDDAVLAATGDAPAYAGLLVARARARAFPGAQAAVCSMASLSIVGRRVERILDETADRRPVRVSWFAASAGLCAAMAAGIAMLMPQVSVAQEKDSPKQARPAAAVEAGIKPRAADADKQEPPSSPKNVSGNDVVKTAYGRPVGAGRNSIVKIVNGRPILQSEVDDLMQARTIELRRTSGTVEEFRAGLKDMRSKALDWLIDQELIVAEFYALDPQVGAKIDAHVEEVIRKQFIDGIYNGDQAAFEKAIGESGISMEDFRAQQRKNVIVELMLARFAKPDSFLMTEEQRAAWLKQNEAKLRSGEKLKLWSLTIPGKAEGKTEDQQRALAEEIRASLVHGADFATLARRHSVDSKRDRGGEWGWVEKKDLNEEFWPAISRLPAGKISEITPLQGNLYMFRVESREEAKMKPQEEVDAAVEKGLMAERREAAAQRWLKELRAKAEIR